MALSRCLIYFCERLFRSLEPSSAHDRRSCTAMLRGMSPCYSPCYFSPFPYTLFHLLFLPSSYFPFNFTSVPSPLLLLLFTPSYPSFSSITSFILLPPSPSSSYHPSSISLFSPTFLHPSPSLFILSSLPYPFLPFLPPPSSLPSALQSSLID